MTLFFGSTATVLAFLLAGFASQIAQTSALKARAQIAADAAALAAVAESGPYGGGQQQREAARFADANGARLLECLCEPASTAAQVRVAVDGIVASARAVFDPSKVMPAELAFSGEGLHPQLAGAVDALLRAGRGSIHIVSGRRSTPRQSILWADAVARYGSAEAADDWVAPPGTSMHEKGLAVDLGGDLDKAVAIVENLGLPLHRPLPHEPWHFELAL